MSAAITPTKENHACSRPGRGSCRAADDHRGGLPGHRGPPRHRRLSRGQRHRPLSLDGGHEVARVPVLAAQRGGLLGVTAEDPARSRSAAPAARRAGRLGRGDRRFRTGGEPDLLHPPRSGRERPQAVGARRHQGCRADAARPGRAARRRRTPRDRLDQPVARRQPDRAGHLAGRLREQRAAHHRCRERQAARRRNRPDRAQ